MHAPHRFYPPIKTTMLESAGHDRGSAYDGLVALVPPGHELVQAHFDMAAGVTTGRGLIRQPRIGRRRGERGRHRDRSCRPIRVMGGGQGPLAPRVDCRVDEAGLWVHRTEPVRVVIHVDELLSDRTEAWSQYIDAEQEIYRREEVAEAADPAIDLDQYLSLYDLHTGQGPVPRSPEAPAWSWETWRADLVTAGSDPAFLADVEARIRDRPPPSQSHPKHEQNSTASRTSVPTA